MNLRVFKEKELLIRLAFQQHGVALLALFTWALGCSLFSWSVGFEQRWTSDTTDTFYRIVSQTLGRSDSLYGQNYWTTLWAEVTQVLVEKPITNWYQGLFDAYLRSFHVAWGDISLAYKIQVFPFTLLFSVVAYFFFLSLTGNRWVALALAFAALMPLPFSWAGERAGLGPIWTYTRRYFLTVWLPLIVWLYFHGIRERNAWLLFAVATAGFASNLHASGVILLEIFVLTWLVCGAIVPKRILQSGGLMVLGLLFSMTGISSLWERGLKSISEIWLTGLGGIAIAEPTTTFQVLADAKAASQASLQYLFYPPKIYGGLPGWIMDTWLVLTILLSFLPLLLRALCKKESSIALFGAAAACLLFVSFEQMWPWILLATLLFLVGRKEAQATTFPLACYLILATFWISVVGMLIFQLGYGLIDGFPFIFNQLRGIRFMGFWVFVWIAILSIPALANWPKASPRLRRGLYIALGIALVLQAQTVYRQYRVQENDRIEEKRALLDIASWAKLNTPPNSIFLVGYSSFGTVAERRIAYTDKVIRNQHIDWLPPKALKNPEETLQLARNLQFTHMFISPADITPTLAKCVVYANASYALAEVTCISRILKVPR